VLVAPVISRVDPLFQVAVGTVPPSTLCTYFPKDVTIQPPPKDAVCVGLFLVQVPDIVVTPETFTPPTVFTKLAP